MRCSLLYLLLFLLRCRIVLFLVIIFGFCYFILNSKRHVYLFCWPERGEKKESAIEQNST